MRRRKFQMFLRHACLAARHVEHLLDLFRENPVATHPRTKIRIVKLALTDAPDAVQHFFFATGKMFFEPLLEQRRNQLRAELPIRRVVGPADVAALAVHLMTNTALTGATYDIDGGEQLVSGA